MTDESVVEWYSFLFRMYSRWSGDYKISKSIKYRKWAVMIDCPLVLQY